MRRTRGPLFASAAVLAISGGILAGPAGAAGAIGASITAKTAACTVSVKMVPSCGVWVGAYKPPGTGENQQTAFTHLETKAGRPFSMIYDYHDMSNTGSPGQFPDSYEKSLGLTRLLMMAMVSRQFSSGKQLLWSNIAAGKYDASAIDPEAARLKAYGKPIFLTFDPEMDGRFRLGIAGTTAQYVAAYRHIHDRMIADGATNVIWVWTVTGYQAHDANFKLLYPGNAYVDWIGYDPYNFAACHKEAWKSFNQTIDPFYQWLEANGYGSKPFILPEYGTVIDSSTPSAAAAWFSGIPASLAAHPNIKALMAFDDTAGGCNTELNLGPGELAAFGAAIKAVASPSTP
jgi:hypothetical protein